MIFNFVYEKETMKKADFYQWMKDKITEAGWVKLSNGREKDYDVFKSTGESGEDNLMLQIREFYSQNDNFSSTQSGDLTFKILHSYTPNSDTKKPGTFLPPLNTDYLYFHGLYSVFPQEELTVYHHVTKDSAYFIIEPPAYKDNYSTCFFGFGKLKRVSASDEYSQMTIFSSSANNAAVGIPKGTNPNVTLAMTFQVEQMPRSITPSTGQWNASDIVIQNNTEGYRAKIENIFYISGDYMYKSQFIHPGMRDNTFSDELGRVFKLGIIPNYSGTYNSFPSRYFCFRIK